MSKSRGMLCRDLFTKLSLGGVRRQTPKSRVSGYWVLQRRLKVPFRTVPFPHQSLNLSRSQTHSTAHVKLSATRVSWPHLLSCLPCKIKPKLSSPAQRNSQEKGEALLQSLPSVWESRLSENKHTDLLILVRSTRKNQEIRVKGTEMETWYL